MNTTVQLHPSLPAFSRIVYGAWRMNDGAETDAAVKGALVTVVLVYSTRNPLW